MEGQGNHEWLLLTKQCVFLVFVIFDGPFDLEQNPGTFLGRSSNSVMVWSPGHSKGFGQVLNGKMFATMGMPFTNGNNHMCICPCVSF